MALRVELLVEWIFLCASGGVWNDGFRSLLGDSFAQSVTVVGGIRHDGLGGKLFNQSVGLWCITFLACCVLIFV
ncbi:hypothetical protein BBL07_00435 [Agrobacterium vitis]|nr:hypothetical protein BBL07_00435 [Agrobacterium vitis]